MMISNRVPIALDEKLLHLGINRKIAWEPAKAPHAIIVGSTGSGKTYLSKLFLGKIAKYIADATLYVCDFKGDDDFYFLDGCKHYYRFQECIKGLDEFYQAFSERQSRKSTERTMLLLFFDEWASFVNYCDKKVAEDVKKKLSNILMLGRSFNVHVVLSQQRADAKYFETARDNFNLVIGLGNLSPESKEMLFYDYKDEMSADCKQGIGYILTNGMDLTKIIVPSISDMELLHGTIRRAVE